MTKGLLDAIQDNNSNTIERLKLNSKQTEYGLLANNKKYIDEKCKDKYQIKGGLLDVATK
jgi:hypothetical protein